jgi:hypothetical protein
VCGDDATWYRIAAPSARPPSPEGSRRRSSVGAITAADLDANLCGACFAQLVSEAEREEAWKYVAPRRAAEGSGFGPAAEGAGEECQVSPWEET